MAEWRHGLDERKRFARLRLKKRKGTDRTEQAPHPPSLPLHIPPVLARASQPCYDAPIQPGSEVKYPNEEKQNAENKETRAVSESFDRPSQRILSSFHPTIATEVRGVEKNEDAEPLKMNIKSEPNARQRRCIKEGILQRRIGLRKTTRLRPTAVCYGGDSPDAVLDMLLLEFNEEDGYKTKGLKGSLSNNHELNIFEAKEIPHVISVSDSQMSSAPATHDDICLKCKEGGHLICCDSRECKSAMHLQCVLPPMLCVPKGLWYCPICAVKSVGLQAIQTKLPHEAPRQLEKGEISVSSRYDYSMEPMKTASAQCHFWRLVPLAHVPSGRFRLSNFKCEFVSLERTTGQLYSTFALSQQECDDFFVTKSRNGRVVLCVGNYTVVIGDDGRLRGTLEGFDDSSFFTLYSNGIRRVASRPEIGLAFRHSVTGKWLSCSKHLGSDSSRNLNASRGSGESPEAGWTSLFYLHEASG